LPNSDPIDVAQNWLAYVPAWSRDSPQEIAAEVATGSRLDATH
jgi:hypothetical protein